MSKVLVFDMDGTIADLYGVKDWLPALRSENPMPYVLAKPMYDMDTLNNLLNELKLEGWKIVVTTWLAKNSSKEYDNKVRKAKLEWLKKHKFPYDEVHMVKYGRTKADCTRKMGKYQILVDDNAKVRKGWTLGGTIDATEDIIEKLMQLMIDN